MSALAPDDSTGRCAGRGRGEGGGRAADSGLCTSPDRGRARSTGQQRLISLHVSGREGSKLREEATAVVAIPLFRG